MILRKIKKLSKSLCLVVFLGACNDPPVNQTSADRAKNSGVGNQALREATPEFANTFSEISPGLYGDPSFLENRGTHEGSGYDSSRNLAPTISVDPGADSGVKYYDVFDVDITCAQNGDYDCTEIAYSINGTDPNFETGNKVTGNTHTVEIGGDGPGSYTLKAVGKSTTGKIGAIRTYNYYIYDRNSQVIYDPIPGTYYQAIDVRISCGDNENCQAIKYSINDGSEFERDEFSLNVQGSYTLEVSYQNAEGDWVSEDPVSYIINFQCNGYEISETGSIPCNTDCSNSSLDSEFRLPGANFNNMGCNCVETHHWSHEEDKCVVKKEILQLIF